MSINYLNVYKDYYRQYRKENYNQFSLLCMFMFWNLVLVYGFVLTNGYCFIYLIAMSMMEEEEGEDENDNIWCRWGRKFKWIRAYTTTSRWYSLT